MNKYVSINLLLLASGTISSCNSMNQNVKERKRLPNELIGEMDVSLSPKQLINMPAPYRYLNDTRSAALEAYRNEYIIDIPEGSSKEEAVAIARKEMCRAKTIGSNRVICEVDLGSLSPALISTLVDRFSSWPALRIRGGMSSLSLQPIGADTPEVVLGPPGSRYSACFIEKLLSEITNFQSLKELEVDYLIDYHVLKGLHNFNQLKTLKLCGGSSIGFTDQIPDLINLDTLKLELNGFMWRYDKYILCSFREALEAGKLENLRNLELVLKNPSTFFDKEIALIRGKFPKLNVTTRVVRDRGI